MDETSPLLDARRLARPVTRPETRRANDWGYMLVLASVLLNTLLTSLDTTVATSLFVTIGTEFKQLHLVPWIGIAFMIGSCAINPIVAKLSHVFGQRAAIAAGALALALGCLGSGLASSMILLIVARFVQGIGAGAVGILALNLIVTIVPPARVSFWQSTLSSAWGLGGAIGGVYGGSVHAYLGWRWAFLLQVPFIALANGLIVYLVAREEKGPDEEIDLAGSCTLVSAVVLLTLAISTGGSQFAWSSPVVVGSLVASVCLLGVFVAIEGMVAVAPVIPLSILTQRNVWAVATLQFLGGMSTLIAQYYYPVWLSVVKGYDAQTTGIHIIPMSLSISVAGLLVGLLMLHVGHYRVLIAASFALHTAASALLCLLQPAWPAWVHLFAIGLFGFGECGWNSVSVVVMIKSVLPRQVPIANSILWTSRGTGSPVGVAAASAVLQWLLRNRLLRDGIPDAVIGRVTRDIGVVKTLPPHQQAQVMAGYESGLQWVFVSVLATGVAAWLASVFLCRCSLAFS